MGKQLKEYGLTPEQMCRNLDAFGDKITGLLSQLGLDLSGCLMDHIALRINSRELASLAHQEWKEQGRELSSAQINGRPIIVIKLARSLNCAGWSVDCLELPYPAEGRQYPVEGWEHVEFVVPATAQSADEYLAELKARFPELGRNWASLAQMGIKTKLSSPKGEGERLANPTVAFKWDNICIKLHPHSLEAVVASEKTP